MNIINFSSREFYNEPSRAKREASRHTVIITDRGKPAHVLMSFQMYQKLMNNTPFKSKTSNLGERLSAPDTAEIEFQAPELNLVIKPADFT